MSTTAIGACARLAAMALAGAIASTRLCAAPIPFAHVVKADEAADKDMAYVVLLPHLAILKQRQREVDGVLMGKTTDGRAVTYAVAIPPDRPTVLGMEPGRYWFARVYEGDGYWSLEENDSQFDARPGQMNYPGDWYINVEYHDITRGARTIGHRIAGTLTIGGGSVDMTSLGLDRSIASLPLLQTHVDPTGHANGFGER